MGFNIFTQNIFLLFLFIHHSSIFCILNNANFNKKVIVLLIMGIAK